MVSILIELWKEKLRIWCYMLEFAVSESQIGVTFYGESNQSHSGRCTKDPFRGDTVPKNPQFLLTLSKIAAGFSTDRCFNLVRSGL